MIDTKIKATAKQHTMTHSTIHPLATSPDVVAPSRRIVELPMRLFHTIMAISFLGAYITAESERFRLLHMSLGYTLFALVIFRILWGILGPRQSRLILISVQVETNYPRPSSETTQAYRVGGEPG